MPATDPVRPEPPIMDAVRYRLTMLCFTWHEYRGLFMINEARRQALSNAAMGFFGQMRVVLADAMFVSLCALEAKAKVGGQEQVSFEAMFAEAGTAIDKNPQLGTKARAYLAEFHRLMVPLRSHRDKRIAHADVDAVLGGKPLPTLTIEDLSNSIKLAFRTFNAMAVAIGGGPTVFQHPAIAGDCDAVIHALEAAERFDAIDQWRWRVASPTMSGEEVRQELITKFFDPPWKAVRPRDADNFDDLY